MIRAKEFYRIENEAIALDYEKNLEVIKEIVVKTEACQIDGLKEFYKFFNHAGKWTLDLAALEKKLTEEYFTNNSFEELRVENYSLFSELIGDNYKTSYANPSYCVSVFGDGMGQLISAFYAKLREHVGYAYKHRVFSMHDTNRRFIEAFEAVNNGAGYKELKRIIVEATEESLAKNIRYRSEERTRVDFGFYRETVINSDLKDPKYLFRLGKYITENEVKTQNFLVNYPIEKINTLSQTVVNAFIRSFKVDNKDRKNRNIVRFFYNAGQEIITRQIIKDFKEKGFEVALTDVMSTIPNKQYDYDHRFDNALYLDEAYNEMFIAANEKGFEMAKDSLKLAVGPVFFDNFGEVPFSPEKKNECLKLSKDQEKLQQVQRNRINQIYEKYEASEETSFCIIAFPSPEIGEKFEILFEETMKINMMDNDVYEKIQQYIIDALDLGDYVHIKGKGSNETDIKVKLPKLQDPAKQTNFVNCVADVNIPLGEVFTSPELKGTNGVLHIEDIFLRDLRYRNLKLTFKDGYVVDFSCTNFDVDADNREYVKENLMQLHETLPLGEFAIGTNTYAYVVAQKYNIIELLPILIIEKMGPHFAIGDTCFSWVEDLPVYNILNNKEITARENELSALRKEDINKAYTNVHTDITLPYEVIENISVITYSGAEIDIIRDGKFALKGTEELNRAFEELK